MSRPGKEIVLNDHEYKRLTDFVSKGTHSAKLITRAKVILDLDASRGKVYKSMAEVGRTHSINRRAVAEIWNVYLKLGVDGIVKRKRRKVPPIPQKVDGNTEAHLIALCCSKPPEGYGKWSVRLVAEKMIEMEIVETISHMTVQRTLKKLNLSLT